MIKVPDYLKPEFWEGPFPLFDPVIGAATSMGLPRLPACNRRVCNLDIFDSDGRFVVRHNWKHKQGGEAVREFETPGKHVHFREVQEPGQPWQAELVDWLDSLHAYEQGGAR